MENQIIYQFASAQVANRFLNTLKNWSVATVNAKLYRGADKVKVSYEYSDSGFDRTCAELDDLAARHEGTEVS